VEEPEPLRLLDEGLPLLLTQLPPSEQAKHQSSDKTRKNVENVLKIVGSCDSSLGLHYITE